MNGYVQNKLPVWAHVMKRSVGPGDKINLDELYTQYGAKHGLSEGEEFVGWLRNVKLKDREKWNIVFSPELKAAQAEETKVEKVKIETEEEKQPIVTVVKTSRGSGPTTPFVAEKLKVKDIVDLSVRRAREVLPKVRDLNLLKYAFQEANQLSNKDSLCRELRKRIKEIQIAS